MRPHLHALRHVRNAELQARRAPPALHAPRPLASPSRATFPCRVHNPLHHRRRAVPSRRHPSHPVPHEIAPVIIDGREEAGPAASPRRWERWWRCPLEGWATLRHPLWIRAEQAHHEITPVIIEGRKGGRPWISEGRLRRGPSGEGEVTKIEVVIEEGQGAAGT